MITKIMKFGANWCGPCKRLRQELQNFNKVPIEEYDVDENEELCNLHNIRNIPALLFINENGEIVERSAGFISKSDVEAIVDKYGVC